MPHYDVGQYRAKIIDLATGVSKNKNTPYIQIVIEPAVYLDVANNEELILDVVYERDIKLWLTENTKERVCEDLRRIGYVRDDFNEIDEGPAHDAVVGTEIQVRCEHEEYEGKTWDRFYLSGGGGNVERARLTPDKVKKLNALFGKTLKATAKPSGGNGQGAAEQNVPLTQDNEPFKKEIEEVAADDDSEIPF
jgi:hypothetical protein